jgi:hypothetical protein
MPWVQPQGEVQLGCDGVYVWAEKGQSGPHVPPRVTSAAPKTRWPPGSRPPQSPAQHPQSPHSHKCAGATLCCYAQAQRPAVIARMHGLHACAAPSKSSSARGASAAPNRVALRSGASAAAVTRCAVRQLRRCTQSVHAEVQYGCSTSSNATWNASEARLVPGTSLKVGRSHCTGAPRAPGRHSVRPCAAAATAACAAASANARDGSVGTTCMWQQKLRRSCCSSPSRSSKRSCWCVAKMPTTSLCTRRAAVTAVQAPAHSALQTLNAPQTQTLLESAGMTLLGCCDRMVP